LTQAQTAGQYFTNDQIKEMTRKVSAEVDLVHQQTQNQRYGSSHIGATAKDISSTTLPTAYDVYPLDGRHDGGYYTVKDCVTIDVLPRTPGNNVYVGFMVWSNFTATKCRGLVPL